MKRTKSTKPTNSNTNFRFPGPYGKHLSSSRWTLFLKIRRCLFPLPVLASALLCLTAFLPAMQDGRMVPSFGLSIFLTFARIWILALGVYGISFLLWKAAAHLFSLAPLRKLFTLGYFSLLAVAGILLLPELSATQLADMLKLSRLPRFSLSATPFLACLSAGIYTGSFLVLSRKKAQDPAHAAGEAFEKYCVKVLKKNGFHHVKRIGRSGDHGVDILCRKRMRVIAIQCKCYSGGVGNSAVQQVYTGKNFYHADTAVVMTNSCLTAQARQEAAHLDVILWDRQNFEHNSFPVRSGKRS